MSIYDNSSESLYKGEFVTVSFPHTTCKVLTTRSEIKLLNCRSKASTPFCPTLQTDNLVVVCRVLTSSILHLIQCPMVHGKVLHDTGTSRIFPRVPSFLRIRTIDIGPLFVMPRQRGCFEFTVSCWGPLVFSGAEFQVDCLRRPVEIGVSQVRL